MPAILRVALLASLTPTLVSALGPQVYTVPDDNRIVLVECDNSRGSAFRVGPRILLSVHHVTSNRGCLINGKPFQVLRHRDSQDFSILVQPGKGFIPVDCSGFKPGKRYVAIGHARGKDELTAVELEGTPYKDPDSKFALLKGMATVIPGQSGGPVLDPETGRVVGTVNVYSAPQGISGSRALEDTEICKRAG